MMCARRAFRSLRESWALLGMPDFGQRCDHIFEELHFEGLARREWQGETGASGMAAGGYTGTVELRLVAHPEHEGLLPSGDFGISIQRRVVCVRVDGRKRDEFGRAPTAPLGMDRRQREAKRPCGGITRFRDFGNA